MSQERPRVRVSRSRGRFALAIVLQIALTVALLEGGLRLLQPYNAGLRALLYIPAAVTDFAEYDSIETLMGTTILGFQPYTPFRGFILNSKSFRSPEYEVRKEPGTLRVVVIGDSFAFASGGVPFPYHFPSVIERELAAQLEQKVEVINLGVAAVGPQFELRMFQVEGTRLAPDRIVLTFFIGNDFTDDYQHEPIAGASRSPSVWLAHRSLLFRVARNLVRLSGSVESGAVESIGSEFAQESAGSSPAAAEPNGQRGGYELEAYRDAYDPMTPTFVEEEFLAMEGRRMAICLRSGEKRFKYLLAQTLATLEAFHSEAQAAGIPMTVVLIPDEFQVDDALAARVLEAAGHDAREFIYDLPQRELVRELDAIGVDTLDLLPDFRAKADSGRLYKLRDTHWNRRGSELAGKRIAAHLSNPQN